MATADAQKDQAKGRVKQAAGTLIGDKDLEREGKVDRAAGKAKEAIDKARDAITGKDKEQ